MKMICKNNIYLIFSSGITFFLQRPPEIEESSASDISSSKQLAKIGLKTNKMPMDGNCFFHAIVDQLRFHNHRENIRYDARECRRPDLNIRSDAIGHLEKRKNQSKEYIDTNEYPSYENFIVTNEYPSFDDYIKRMKEDNHYADHLAISATAIMLRKNIIVHQIDVKPSKIPGGVDVPHEDQLHVWYNLGKRHYDSVVSSDGSKPKVLPLEEMMPT